LGKRERDDENEKPDLPSFFRS
jgi:hypothetical protein